MLTRIPGTQGQAWINPADKDLVQAAKDTRAYYRYCKPAGLGIGITMGVLSVIFATVASVIPKSEAQALGWLGVVFLVIAVIGLGFFTYGRLVLVGDAKKRFEHAFYNGNAVRVDSHTYRTLESLLYLSCNIEISVIVQATQTDRLYERIVQPYVYACQPLEIKRVKAEDEAEITAICQRFLQHATRVVEQLINRAAHARATSIGSVHATAQMLGKIATSTALQNPEQ